MRQTINDCPRPYYNGARIAPTTDRLTLEHQLKLLDWHPIFTGECPNCERPIRETTPSGFPGNVGIGYRDVQQDCGFNV